MKIYRVLITLVISFFIAISTIAQGVPQGFKYQAIARDAQGNELVNKNLSVQLSVISRDATGLTEWQESHSITTNAFGLYDLVVGDGSSTGNGAKASFNEIEWSKSEHFLKIEVDFGTGMLNMGTIQLLAVPYALYAEKSQTKFADGEFAIINTADKADNPIAAPSGFATGSPGNVDVGSHDYKITYITDSGETGPGAASSSVALATPGQVMLTSIPISAEPSVRQRGIYRRFNGTGDYLLAGVLNDNSTAIYTDNSSNSSLGKIIPGVNATEVAAGFDISGLSQQQTYTFPDFSGRIVIDTINVSVKTVADKTIVNHGRSVVQQLFNSDYEFSADGGEWGEAYTSSQGKNLSVDLIQTTCYFDGDCYKPFQEQSYLILEAGSLVSSDFQINGCDIKELGEGKWIIIAEPGTNEEKRARIFKTLFYGTNGSDPRVVNPYVTDITSIKTPVIRDIGKNAVYSEYGFSGGHSSADQYRLGTFSNTTTNLSCSFWSVVGSNNIDLAGDTDVNSTTTFAVPENSAINSLYVLEATQGWLDEIGTDKSEDELDNPESTRFIFDNRFSGGAAGPWAPRVKALFLLEGTITWDLNMTTHVDFNSDLGIPFLSDASSEKVSSLIVHNIPSGKFSSNFKNAFLTVLVKEWETGAGIQFKFLNDLQETEYGDYNKVLESAIEFTQEPTKLVIKLIPKSDNPTPGVPAIKGVYITEL